MNQRLPARTVEQIRADASEDPVRGLMDLAAYLDAGETKLAEARRLRLQLIDAARRQDPPVTWRKLVEATGASEPFLRRALNEYREKGTGR
jgi:hypothetical protein